MTDVPFFDQNAWPITSSDGVVFLETASSFEALYEQARSAEDRILTDVQVARLPNGAGLWNADEWRIRSKSATRLQQALGVGGTKHILEVGCGNGWLSGLLHRSRHQVLGIDLFTLELKQAARVFHSGPCFARCSPFATQLPTRYFDVVVLAASLQYFEDLPRLMDRLFTLLKPGGKVHVMDTVLYEDEHNARAARERTERYYANIQVPELSAHYHAHMLTDLQGLARCQVLAAPRSASLLHRLLKRSDPFSHLVLDRV
ncbi:MAG: class I SAM-dependent methyltransferase [Flavobacteriales bacterium]